MKKKLFFSVVSIFIIGCSSSKKSHKKKMDSDTETTLSQIAKKRYNQEFENKINGIITNYLGVSISSIARSAVTPTEDGYQWRFMNVKTGENFIAYSDTSLSSVHIEKNRN